ncbi:uncharacterized protein AC631_01269 [Debaryomyces fabryi]|uniref:Uncharacterized protein n=1 Tax=Debaryomyces fabryi TaxID=58627 RepID=A0A0V1Q3S3_9ASCO|nr:uncharacterized protein AC631_01269 [Debaryomyces fabryi]KSA03014.1 hypothetical protein AC631_01269 [Debaryomyces fabryi]CUM47362.1 unnamed protein product [Debaryomyces fabryi]
MNFKKLLRLCFILLFADVVIGVPLIPLKPSEDDFYTPPEGYENHDNGEILKMRPTPQKLRSLFLPINIKNSWQVLVKSSDSFGNASAIVTTIMEPYNADPSKVVSYQAFEDSAALDCAPSYAYLYRASAATASTQIEMYFIQIALDRGWYVVSPDYEGPKATFTAGKQSGHATLDSIRAALLSSGTTGINKDAKIVMWGYSGGTVPSAWASVLQPTYAKDLKSNLIGAATGGLVTNVTGTAEGVEGTFFAGLTISAITGLASEYPELKALISEQLVSAKTLLYEKGDKLCLGPALFNYAFRRIFSGPSRYVKDGWVVLSHPVVKKVINDNTLALEKGDPMPEIPIFVFHGAKDTLVPFKDAQRVYDNWCEEGIKSFEFAVDKSTGHITELLAGTPAAIAWITKMFNGEKPVKGCSRTERQSNLEYPGSDRSIFEFLSAAATSILGFEIGPNAENLEPNGENIKISTKAKKDTGVTLGEGIEHSVHR